MPWQLYRVGSLFHPRARLQSGGGVEWLAFGVGTVEIATRILLRTMCKAVVQGVLLSGIADVARMEGCFVASNAGAVGVERTQV